MWISLLCRFEILVIVTVTQLFSLGLCESSALVAVCMVCGNSLLVAAAMHPDSIQSLVASIYGLCAVAFSSLELMNSTVILNLRHVNPVTTAYYLIIWSWINGLFAVRSWRERDAANGVFFSSVCISSVTEAVGSATGLTLYRAPNIMILVSLAPLLVTFSKDVVSIQVLPVRVS
jgi:hypothetical protein